MSTLALQIVTTNQSHVDKIDYYNGELIVAIAEVIIVKAPGHTLVMISLVDLFGLNQKSI